MDEDFFWEWADKHPVTTNEDEVEIPISQVLSFAKYVKTETALRIAWRNLMERLEEKLDE